MTEAAKKNSTHWIWWVIAAGAVFRFWTLNAEVESARAMADEALSEAQEAQQAVRNLRADLDR